MTQRRLAAILAADMVGYSRLMAADEAGTLARLKALRRDIIDPEIAKAGGEIVKLTGDGMLVLFGSVVAAVESAAAVQKAICAAEAATPEDRRIAFRIGLHLGDVMLDEGDIYGDGVNIAARLEAEAEPGGVTLSDDAYRQVSGKTELSFIDVGELSLKNIPAPVKAHKIDLDPARLTPSEFETMTGERLELPDRPSIAVLPFQSMSGDPDQEFFADGIVEDIITMLSCLSGLVVMARNSTFTYKDRAVDVRSVGHDLGVRHVLEGSVRKAGGRVRVSAQLIDAGTGDHVWAERYDRNLDDIFSIQDEITREIVVALDVELRHGEQAHAWSRLSGSFEAWKFAKRIAQEAYKYTRDGARHAAEMARELIAMDPDYPAGRILLAYHQTNAARFGAYEDRDAAVMEALAVINAVTEEAPELASAQAARGHVLLMLNRFDEAIKAGTLACDLAPNVSHNHFNLGCTYIAVADYAAALRQMQTAMRLSPYFPNMYLFPLAEAHRGLGDHRRARAVAEHWVVRAPDRFRAWLRLARIAAAQGDRKRAAEATSVLLAMAPQFSSRAVAAEYAYKHAADRDEFLNDLLAAGLPE